MPSPQRRMMSCKDSAKKWVERIMKADSFLSENREHMDKLNLLYCEQAMIQMVYRDNLFNSRGIMRKEAEDRYKNIE